MFLYLLIAFSKLYEEIPINMNLLENVYDEKLKESLSTGKLLSADTIPIRFMEDKKENNTIDS